MACVALALAGIAAQAAAAADPVPSAASGPGWTGLTKTKDLIAARGELMEHMELLMEPIDSIQVDKVRNPDWLRSNAEAIGAMLLAVPHLFPPNTNLYDPKAIEPQTLALPAIWKSFDAFYQLAMAASKSAEEMGEAKGDAALRAASLRLRASCDACHTIYLRKAVSLKPQQSDYDFDFDAALGLKKK